MRKWLGLLLGAVVIISTVISLSDIPVFEKAKDIITSKSPVEMPEVEIEHEDVDTDGKHDKSKENNGKLDDDYGLIKEKVELVRVIDGDTVVTMSKKHGEERIRLLLIDTPESVHPDEPVQAYGPESSVFAKDYLKEGSMVTLERGNPEKDKYDRTLGYIWVNDGERDVNFNKLMLEKGFARIAYVFEPNTKYLDEFDKAQEQAKEEELNIWSVDGYVTDKGFDMSKIN